MRKKPNLIPRMERCAAVLEPPQQKHCGRWLMDFPEHGELHIEIGCGKGRFTNGMAEENPGVLFLAIERVPEALVVSMERTIERGLSNIRYFDLDAETLCSIVCPDEPQRVYINFPDPWPKAKQAKKRLTAPGFLRSYAAVLPLGGEIWFKTDNSPLFEWSLEQLEADGWLLRELTRDLHENGPKGVMTDYEAKFHAEGVKINRVVAVRTKDTRLPDAPHAAVERIISREDDILER